MRTLQPIGPGILCFPVRTPTLPPATHTNCYVIGHHDAVVVEPASPDPEEQAALQAALEHAEINVGRIFLTHHHADHVGGVDALRQWTGAKVLAHPITRDLLKGQVEIDTLVDEGDTIESDAGTMHLFHTPGHAPGHLCGHLVEAETMIAGDMVAGIGTILLAPHEGDLGEYLASLSRLMALAPSVLLPSHGPPLPEAVAALQLYIDHRNMRSDQIAAALHTIGAPATALEIAPHVYTELPPMYLPIAAEQIKTHLRWLVEHGRAQRLDNTHFAP